MDTTARAQATLDEADQSTAHEALNRVAMNKIEVLNDRLVPGSDGSIEHVAIGNNAVTIIRSAPYKGRVRSTKSDLYVGGVSCQILLTGLEARIDTVRHLVGGDMPVQGGLFLPRQRTAPAKFHKAIVVGSPKAVVQELIAQHCSEPFNPKINSVTRELDAMFFPLDKMSDQAA